MGYLVPPPPPREAEPTCEYCDTKLVLNASLCCRWCGAPVSSEADVIYCMLGEIDRRVLYGSDPDGPEPRGIMSDLPDKILR